MAEPGFVLSDFATIIIAVLVGATALVFVYISNSFQSSKEEKEVKNETTEVPRKKKSANGNSAASKPSKKKQAEKWHPDSNKHNFSHSWLLTSLKGHSGLVLDMDFSSNGKFLATCAEDLDPGGGEQSGNSSGSEGNKENSPEIRANQKPSSGLTRRQKRNRVRREDDSPVLRNQKKKPKAQRISTSSHSNAPALRLHTRLNLVDSDLGVFLRHYLLSVDQLLGLGYPVESAMYPGRAVIYKSQHHTAAPASHFDVNAREFVPMSRQCCSQVVEVDNTVFIAQREHSSVNYSDIGVEWNTERRESSYETCRYEEVSSSSSQEISGSSDYSEISESGTKKQKQWSGSAEKRCVRCSRGFFVTLDGEYLTQERCKYHWGKLQRVVKSATSVRTEYSCCRGGSEAGGCTVGKLHVWNGVDDGINGPYASYVRTKPRKSPPADGNYGIFALDCEMCFTTHGLELTKVTVVGADGKLVYDCLVRPENFIIDYNTRFSGITAKDLDKRGATKSLRNVQSDLLSFINFDSILIGHGLENDLRALRIIHGTVIDTSVTFPHYYGLPYRRSLKSLVACFLKRDIQQDSSGHDSFEDARACIELMLWRVRKDFHSILG